METKPITRSGLSGISCRVSAHSFTLAGKPKYGSPSITSTKPNTLKKKAITPPHKRQAEVKEKACLNLNLNLDLSFLCSASTLTLTCLFFTHSTDACPHTVQVSPASLQAAARQKRSLLLHGLFHAPARRP